MGNNEIVFLPLLPSEISVIEAEALAERPTREYEENAEMTFTQTQQHQGL